MAPHTLTPYIAVREGRRALGWYVELFAARMGGERASTGPPAEPD